MKKSVVLLVTVALLVSTTAAAAESSDAKLPSALGGIPVSEVEPLNDVQAQQIRGGLFLVPLLVVATAAGLVGAGFIAGKVASGAPLTRTEQMLVDKVR